MCSREGFQIVNPQLLDTTKAKGFQNQNQINEKAANAQENEKSKIENQMSMSWTLTNAQSSGCLLFLPW